MSRHNGTRLGGFFLPLTQEGSSPRGFYLAAAAGRDRRIGCNGAMSSKRMAKVGSGSRSQAWCAVVTGEAGGEIAGTVPCPCEEEGQHYMEEGLGSVASDNGSEASNWMACL
jgi:hypothetical protein